MRLGYLILFGKAEHYSLYMNSVKAYQEIK